MKWVSTTAFVSVGAVTLIALFLSLGWWQFQRGLIKQDMEYRLEQNIDADDANRLGANALVPPFPDDLDFSAVAFAVEQVYPQHIFLDNRTRAGQSGLELLSAVRIEPGWILVNRGWLGWDRGAPLPQIEQLDSDHPVEGLLRNWPEKGFTLGEQNYGRDLPEVVLWLDHKELNRYFEGKLLPYLVYIDDNHPQALVTDWKLAGVVSAGKHFSYAVQWLAMALAALVLMVYLLVRLRR